MLEVPLYKYIYITFGLDSGLLALKHRFNSVTACEKKMFLYLVYRLTMLSSAYHRGECGSPG